MKTFKFCLLLFLFNVSLFSQEVYLSVGRNSTAYDYKNSSGESIDGLKTGVGLSLTAGVLYYFDDEAIFHYQGGVTLNQFNASAIISERRYSWNTNYLGLQNLVGIRLFETHSTFSTQVNLGANISHIISGKQFSDDQSFDIKSNPEFKGVFIQPLAGLILTYEISDFVYITGGYNYSFAFNTSSSDEKLSFTNNQLQVGFHFKPR